MVALASAAACTAPSAPAGYDGSSGEIDEPRPEHVAPDSGEDTPSPTEESGTVKLAAFVGGPSIAVRWSTIGEGAAGVDHYVVYRDGAEIAKVSPGFHPDFPEKDGKGFIDANIRAGATYEYRVDAVRAGASPSRVGPPLRVTAPPQLAAPPAITIDTSATPDLATHAATVKAFLEIWWPKVALALALPSFQPTPAFTIKYDPKLTAVYAYGWWFEQRIDVNPAYVRAHPEDLGLYLHEATHILNVPVVPPTPLWVYEGIADWTREYMLHDRDPSPIRGEQHYIQGYEKASYFFEWISETRQVPFVRELTVASHDSKYSSQLFVTHGGKPLGQLWEEMTGQKDLVGPLRWTELANKCVSESGGRAVVAACTDDTRRWEWGAEKDGSIWLRSRFSAMCLDVQSSSTQMGAVVQLYECNHSAAQKWKLQANGTLLNPNSGFCLDNPNGSTVNGTGLRTWDCNGSTAQRFALPSN